MSKHFFHLFHGRLFEWWRANGRVLEWREKDVERVNGQIPKGSLRDRQTGKQANPSTSSGLVAGTREVGKSGSRENPSTSLRASGKIGKWENRLLGSLSVREEVFASYFAGELSRDPYRVIVAEMMLQQTQVERVREKYRAWMVKWPSIEDLAQASLAEVLIEWQGLGYNRRARFLWLLAKEIVEQQEGVWPQTEAELLKLPGIGKYTARALLSFAFGQQVGVVDVNVKRVLGRWIGKESLERGGKSLEGVQTKFQTDPEYSGLNKPSGKFRELSSKFQLVSSTTQPELRTWNLELLLTDRQWFVLADRLVPAGQADPWNQALMDFGALICTARNPKCEQCPMADLCNANLHAQTNGFVNYRELLQTQESRLTGKQANGKRRRKSKDEGLKFEETDRFFRGRIIDLLREKTLPKQDLQEKMNQKYALDDEERFEILLEKLISEGMVSQKGEILQLG